MSVPGLSVDLPNGPIRVVCSILSFCLKTDADTSSEILWVFRVARDDRQ